MQPTPWRKSSYSGDHSDCVEIAIGTLVEVRDTKDRKAGQLSFSPEAWAALLRKC